MDVKESCEPGDGLSKSKLTQSARGQRREAARLAASCASAACVQKLREAGVDKYALYGKVIENDIVRKTLARSNRCQRCWHDQIQSCICRHLRNDLRISLPVKVLVLMHPKEYLNAGDDAKLLLAMLPAEQASLYIFGRCSDMEALQAELEVDPLHTLILWPGEGALTLEEFIRTLPQASGWRSEVEPTSVDCASVGVPSCEVRSTLRVLVLDGVYANARLMFRHLQKHVKPTPPAHVALHPRTLSVYSRAQHGYASASGQSIERKDDPEALRICTVEAFALLLQELGEPQDVTSELVQAVVVNNQALMGVAGSGPSDEISNRARRRKERQERQQVAEHNSCDEIGRD